MKIRHPYKKKTTVNYSAPFCPENCIFVRGKTKKPVIKLPEVWLDIADLSTLTIHLTCFGANQNIIVKRIQDNEIYLQTNGLPVDCYYLIFAERSDVPKLEVEQVLDKDDEDLV